MKQNKDFKEDLIYLSELSVGSLMENLKLNKEDAEALLSKMAEVGDVELLPMLTLKAEALLNKLSVSPSGRRRDYLN